MCLATSYIDPISIVVVQNILSATKKCRIKMTGDPLGASVTC